MIQPRLYALTPDENDTDLQVSRCKTALEAGVSWLQYRNTLASAELREQQALALQPLCRKHDVPLIIESDIDLAERIRADGVHLGQPDQLQIARKRLGPEALIGVACRDSLSHARVMAMAGANYVSFGVFHPSPTLVHAQAIDPSLLTAARELGITVVAIGGITPENGTALLQAGADMLAVLSGIFSAPDPAAAVRAYLSCFENRS